MADQTLNLKLVQEIEKHQCLYNYSLSDYSRKDKVEKAWSEVGRSVNLSGHECKDRWKNLRAVFTRHMKLGPGGKPRKPYYLSESMQFALPYIKNLKTIPERTPPCTEVKLERICDEDDVSISSLSDPLSPASSLSKRVYEDEGNMRVQQTDMRAKKSKIDVKDSQEANRMFLLSLLPDMNQMSSSQTRKFKKRILEYLDDVLGTSSNDCVDRCH